MKKFDYKKFLPKAVIIILCLFFVTGIFWGLNSVLKIEGTMVPVVSEPGLTPAPETAGEAIDFLNTVIDSATPTPSA